MLCRKTVPKKLQKIHRKTPCARVSLFNKSVGYVSTTLTERYPSRAADLRFLQKNQEHIFTEKSLGDCSVLTILLNSVFPIIPSAR